MNRLIYILITVFVALAAQAQTEFETATEAVRNMKVGWNLGNSLDAHKKSFTTIKALETSKGQPVTEPGIIEMMKMAGFNAIRVPVTWYPHLDANNQISDEWLNRVQEVVDYVINQGMYCIINVHHDTGNNSDPDNTDKGWLKADGDNFAANEARFCAIWQQVAERFRDYGPLLIFEGYNELLDKYDSWNYASFAALSYEAETAADAYRAVNDYAAAFIRTVRQSGGNNATRNLIVNTYGGCDGRGTWSNYIQEPLKNLSLPQTELDAGHIIVGLHSYPPIVEKENGTIVGERSLERIQADINTMMQNIETHLFQRLGVPVIIGEWSTSEVDAATSDYDARRQHMLDFADIFVETAKQHGIATFFWMGLSDKDYRALPAFNQPDLAERILKAYYGSDYEPIIITDEDYGGSTHVEFTKKWAEINLIVSKTDISELYDKVEIVFTKTPTSVITFRAYSDDATYKEIGVVSRNQLTTTKLMSTIKALITPVKRLTLVWKNDGTASLDIGQVYLVKSDGSKDECTITSRNACNIKISPRYKTLHVDESTYASLYYSDQALIVPTTLTATAFREANGSLVAARNYIAGDVIPANTPVVIKAPRGAIYKFDNAATSGATALANQLRGSDNDAVTTGATSGGKYYKLSRGLNGDRPIGFYYGAANGGSFTSGAHEAYLVLPATQVSETGFPLEQAFTQSLTIDATTVPDPNLRSYLLSDFTYTSQSGSTVKPGSDGVYSVDELAYTTALDCSSCGIASLEGIQNFKALTSLNCSGNDITVLDLTGNKRLTSLDCSNNALTDLDLSANTALTSLNYSGQLRSGITAESALTIVGYDQANNPIYDSYYYLRLGGAPTGTDEHDLIYRLTETNHDGAESAFAIDNVRAWIGGTVVHGNKRVAAADDVDPANVAGDILLLTDATEQDNKATGTVSYTYDVKNAIDPTGSLGDFTLEWTATPASGTITAISDLAADTQPGVIGITYTDLLGRSATRPFAGVNIVTTSYSDGSTKTRKVMVGER